MRYATICSGIEAPSVAWHDFGWEPVFFSEIEKFPNAVLAHHYPNVPNLGDMTRYKEWKYGTGSVDLVCAGTPCQSFSIAGLRKGLDDPRGNLTLVFLGILEKIRPRWVIWENVPGALSDNTNAFGAFQTGLSDIGYSFSWRILDAQYFSVPQRRRRIFLVGYLGDWRPPFAVLFERACLQGDITPRQKEREGHPGEIARGLGGNGEVISNVSFKRSKGTGGPSGDECQNLIPISFTIRSGCEGGGKGYLGSDDQAMTLGGQEQYLSVPVAYFGMDGDFNINQNISETLDAHEGRTADSAHAIAIENHPKMTVRRITPVECARLQGFPDTYLDIPFGKGMATDGHKYKALGNSMAVPVVRWIGQRIKMVEEIARPVKGGKNGK